MSKLFLSFIVIMCCFCKSIYAQKTSSYPYESSKKHPFGLVNPKAPEQVKDFAPMIGECECQSETRNPDGSWNKPVAMLWRFKYIMNGMAVQDETLKSDGIHSGSIRQYSVDSAQWYVHYYSSNSPSINPLPTWEGQKVEEGNIVLFKDQTAPNGMEGMYRLTFYEMNVKGFKWKGEWVSPDQKIVYPTWKIDCVKRKGKR